VARQPEASVTESPYISPNPYTEHGVYPQQDVYAQQSPYISPAEAAPTGVSGQVPGPGGPPAPHAPEMLQPIRSPLSSRFGGGPTAGGPPPVAPATVDRWAPPERDRAQPTDFTDQGLPRRTRPSTPRAFPGPAPREAKPADPASVLADLDAFASGTADAADAIQAQGPGQLAPLPAAPSRPTLPPSQGPAYGSPTAPAPPTPTFQTPAAPPPPLTDPAQEEF
jgi:serine/threonine-protein kinase